MLNLFQILVCLSSGIEYNSIRNYFDHGSKFNHCLSISAKQRVNLSSAVENVGV